MDRHPTLVVDTKNIEKKKNWVFFLFYYSRQDCAHTNLLLLIFIYNIYIVAEYSAVFRLQIDNAKRNAFYTHTNVLGVFFFFFF